MARVNIDDELQADHRFKKLVKRIGEDLAIGKLYRFWHLAQHYWGKGKQLIPLEEFQDEDWQVLVEVKLAQVRGNFVYAIGAEEQFDWYLKKCEAGRKRADSDRDGEGKFKTASPAQSDCAGSDIQQKGVVLAQESSLLSAPAPLRSSPLHSATVPLCSEEKKTLSLSSEQITKCWEAWSEVLKWAGKERSRSPADEQAIAKAIQRWGFDDVLLAIQGARNEPANEKFNPKQHVALYRIFEKVKGEPCKFEKFLGWGAELRMRTLADHEIKKRRELPPPEETSNPEKVKEFMNQLPFMRRAMT